MSNQICDSVLDLYQVSPLIRLNSLRKTHAINCDMVAKCDFYAGVYGKAIKRRKSLQLSGNVITAKTDALRNRINTVSEECSGQVDVIVQVRSSVLDKESSKRPSPMSIEAIYLETNEDGSKKVIDMKTSQITEKEAVAMVEHVVTHEGIMAGIASGAALAAAVKLAKDLDHSMRVVIYFEDGLLPVGQKVDSRAQLSGTIRDDTTESDVETSADENGVSWNWFDAMKVNDIMTTFALITVTDDDTLRTAINIMQHHNVHQLPVICAKLGVFLGMVTSSDIMKTITTDTMSRGAKVKRVMIKKCPKVARTDDLSKLVTLLDHNPFVAIVDRMAGGDFICMIMTPIEMVSYYGSVISKSDR